MTALVGAIGNVESGGASVTRFVLATSPDIAEVIQTAEMPLGSLTPEAATTQNGTLELSHDLAPGTYYVAVQLDAADAIAETDETDNLSEWIEIEVYAPELELAVTSFSHGLYYGEFYDLGLRDDIAVEFVVENQGNLAEPQLYDY